MAKRKLPKKPKKPRASASVQTWMRFEDRVRAWQKKCNEIKAGFKKKESLIKKYSSF